MKAINEITNKEVAELIERYLGANAYIGFICLTFYKHICQTHGSREFNFKFFTEVFDKDQFELFDRGEVDEYKQEIRLMYLQSVIEFLKSEAV